MQNVGFPETMSISDMYTNLTGDARFLLPGAVSIRHLSFIFKFNVIISFRFII